MLHQQESEFLVSIEDPPNKKHLKQAIEDEVNEQKASD